MQSPSTPLRQPLHLADDDDDLLELIQEGIDEADRGDFVDDEELARDMNAMITDLERRAAERP